MERELHAFLMDQCQVCGIRIFKLFQSDKIYTGIHLFLFFWCKSIYPIHAFIKLRQRNSEVHYRNVQINTLFIRTDRKFEFK